jgi:raffinose/stachyose/melibiose transport system substrate-binding protein
MHRFWRRAALASLLVVASLAAGCGSSGTATNKTAAANAPVTLTWWHNATADPGLSAWQKVADDYHAAHPTVTFKISPIQNEQFTSKIPAALESNDPPDIYQQWGGGAEATQLQSNKLMDMTANVSSWIGDLGPAAKNWQVNGKWYGVPYDYHIVGFWYRTDLFAQAGITAPPKTMDDFNADVAKLKQAGIAPVAIGSKDRWPDAFYWEYFVLRECPQATISNSINAKAFTDPCFAKAGQDMQALLATKPFQTGFLGTPAQQGAGSSAGLVANGKAAMELQGDWDMAVMPSLAADKKFASKMGWFPFPSVTGGGGDANASLGGGDGFTCTRGATRACPDFLKYMTSTAVQEQLIKAVAVTLPSNPAANGSVTDPTLKTTLAYLGGVSYNQLYFDQALPTDSGQALDSAVADFFAGKGTPASIAASVAGATGP